MHACVQMRENRKYAYSLPLYERLPLVWDESVTAELAAREMLGGYSGGYARQGASKCVEVVEQLLDLLEDAPCEQDSLEQQFRLRKGDSHAPSGSLDVEVVCEPAPRSVVAQVDL
jgi:hypothetical protein